MSFLAPWFLALGVAAAVPLLIHLLRRRTGVEVEFPAARYLLRAEREHSRSLRMRNMLLMLLRVAAVVLLALAASRPTTRVAGAGHAPTALAIVLDNTLSTSVVQDGTPLLDQLKRSARDVIAGATPDDRLWLLTADGTVRSGSKATLADEVDRVRVFAGTSDLRSAVERAISTAGVSGMVARQVVVLTDGQRTSWRDAAANAPGVPVLVFAPGGRPPVNRAVTIAEARPVRWTPRGAVAARALAADSTTYRMDLGGNTLARGTMAPGEEAVIHASPLERGWTWGRVEIQPDELSADNSRFFATWIGAPPAVRALPGSGPFARNAVAVLESSQRVEEGAGISIGGADEATSLPALLVPPTDPVRLGAANRALERLAVPWRFGVAHRESSVAHGAQLDNVNVALRYELLARGAAETETLAVVAGEAWIVAGPRYVLAGSPLTPDATSLPVSASFLPWLADVLASRLHPEPGTVRYATPGASVTRPSGVEAIESVDGARTPVTGTRFDAPAAAGTYFFIQGSRRVGALVVNPETTESVLDRWSADELRAHVASSAVRAARDRTDLLDRAFRGAAQRSLVMPLLFVALLVLSVEMIVAAADALRRQA